MKFFLYVTGSIIFICIILSFIYIDFFYSEHRTVVLSVMSFWITCLALIISLCTLLVAKSIKKAKIEYTIQEQRNQKRVNLKEIIKKIKNAEASGWQLSVEYIRGLRAFIHRLDVSEPSLQIVFNEEIEKFLEVTDMERNINTEELVVTLTEISNIMEQDNAARQ